VDHSEVPFSLPPIEGTVVLQKCVSAIPITLGKNGKTEMAPIAMLPEGAALQICGDGFDEMTVRAQWAGQAYYVFCQDLRPSRKPSGSERFRPAVMRQGA
jgi:hypothetical protein